jgi:hypothetical protein
MTEMTTEERALYDAQAKEEAWGYAESILRPLAGALRAVGSEELNQAMQAAVDEAMREYRRALEAAEASRG